MKKLNWLRHPSKRVKSAGLGILLAIIVFVTVVPAYSNYQNQNTQQFNNIILQISNFQNLVQTQINAINDAINSMSAQITAIINNVTLIQSDITDLWVQIALAQLDIAFLQASQTVQDADILALQLTVISLQNQITSNDLDIATLYANIAGINLQLGIINSEISSLQAYDILVGGQISDLQLRVSVCETDIAVIRAQISNIENVEIPNLQNQIDSLNAIVQIIYNWFISVRPIVTTPDYFIYNNGSIYIIKYGSNNTVFSTSVTLSGCLSQISQTPCSIFLKNGFYNVSGESTISLLSGQIFLSNNATIYRNDLTAIITLANKINIKICGFTFYNDWNSYITPLYLIHLSNCKQISIMDNFFISGYTVGGVQSCGICLSNTNDSIITNNKFDTFYTAIVLSLNSSSNIVDDNQFLGDIWNRIYDTNVYDLSYFNNVDDEEIGQILPTPVLVSTRVYNTYGTRVMIFVREGGTTPLIVYKNGISIGAVCYGNTLTMILDGGEAITLSAGIDSWTWWKI